MGTRQVDPQGKSRGTSVSSLFAATTIGGQKFECQASLKRRNSDVDVDSDVYDVDDDSDVDDVNVGWQQRPRRHVEYFCSRQQILVF